MEVPLYSNSRLTIPRESKLLLTCSDESHPYNNIVRDDLKKDSDYLLVNKDQWKIVETYVNSGI